MEKLSLFNPRRYLTPLGKGPWLADRSMRWAWKWIAGTGLALILGTSLLIHGLISAHKPSFYQPSPWFLLLLFLGILLLGCGILFGLATLLPRMGQTCPACLRGMTFGATTCPHCHFHEGEKQA